MLPNIFCVSSFLIAILSKFPLFGENIMFRRELCGLLLNWDYSWDFIDVDVNCAPCLVSGGLWSRAPEESCGTAGCPWPSCRPVRVCQWGCSFAGALRSQPAGGRKNETDLSDVLLAGVGKGVVHSRDLFQFHQNTPLFLLLRPEIHVLEGKNRRLQHAFLFRYHPKILNTCS